MAVAFRGVDSTLSSNPTTTFNKDPVANIAGLAAGDLMVLSFTSRDHLAATAQPTVSDASGDGVAWTQVSFTTDRKAQLWAKIVNAAFITAGAVVTVAGCVGSCAGVLKAFSGTDTTVAAAFDTVVQESNIAANETHASYTPAVANEMMLGAIFDYANDDAASTLAFATLGALTTTTFLSTGGNDCAVALGHVAQVGGPTATGAFTWAQVDATTYSFVFGLKPPVAVAGFLPHRSPLFLVIPQ